MSEDKSNKFLVPSIIYNIDYFFDSLVKMPIAKIAEWITNRQQLSWRKKPFVLLGMQFCCQVLFTEFLRTTIISGIIASRANANIRLYLMKNWLQI